MERLSERLKLLSPALVFTALALALLGGLDKDPTLLPSPLLGKPLPAFSLPSLEGAERPLPDLPPDSKLKLEPGVRGGRVVIPPVGLLRSSSTTSPVSRRA